MTNEPIKIPVLIAGLSTKVDGSVKIVLETQELPTEQAGQLYGMRNMLAWAVIAPEATESIVLPKETPDPAMNVKTPSQRLRARMFVYFKEKGISQDLDFDLWYKAELERIGQRYLDKLDI